MPRYGSLGFMQWSENFSIYLSSRFNFRERFVALESEREKEYAIFSQRQTGAEAQGETEG